MGMSFIEDLKGKITGEPVKIVFPEGEDPRVVEAAVRVKDEGIGIPVVLGTEEQIAAAAKEAGVSVDGIETIDPQTSDKLAEYVEKYSEETGFPAMAAEVLMKKPLGYAAAMLRFDDAEAYIGGAINRTSDVIQNCRQIVGMEEGIDTPSSFMIMNTPHFATEEGNAIIFADPGVNINPDANQLADIAIATARSTKRLLGWEPRVAMLSFSTHGSAAHADADKVIEALKIVKEKEPDLLIDGEMQADAAIVPSVAKAKIKEESSVAGRANVLIFPDLDAGNIGFKLVQRMGDAGAYGPFLQGFAKTASDLSRGCLVDDIVGVAVMAVLEAQGRRG